MKRFIAVATVIISIMSLSGCSSNTENTSNLSEILAEYNDSNSSEESAVGLDEIIAETDSSTYNSEEYSNIADTEKHDNNTTSFDREYFDQLYKEYNNSEGYEFINIHSMIDELHNNAYRAKQTYLNKYVAFAGYIYDFDANGEYVLVTDTNNEYDFDFVYCYSTYVSDEEMLILNTGDNVLVMGKVRDVDEYIGYSIDCYAIGKYEQ